MVFFVELDQATWDRMIAVNLTGVFHTIQAAVGDVTDARWGRVVTISASRAQVRSPCTWRTTSRRKAASSASPRRWHGSSPGTESR